MACVTPLMMAAKTRSKEVLDVLLQAGADPNKVDTEGHTAFVYALQSNGITLRHLI